MIYVELLDLGRVISEVKGESLYLNGPLLVGKDGNIGGVHTDQSGRRVGECDDRQRRLLAQLTCRHQPHRCIEPLQERTYNDHDLMCKGNKEIATRTALAS